MADYLHKKKKNKIEDKQKDEEAPKQRKPLFIIKFFGKAGKKRGV